MLLSFLYLQMMSGLLKEPPQLNPPEELDMIAKLASAQLIELLQVNFLGLIIRPLKVC